MVFPWIQLLQEQEKKRLSDIEFLAKKEFDGKLVRNEGTKSAVGTLCTLTASSGKDMYIARAKCIFHANTAIGFEEVANKVELQLNGIVFETAIISMEFGSGGGSVGAIEYDFKNIGGKVAATQVIKLEVITMTGSVDVEGFVECFEETTGASPVI